MALSSPRRLGLRASCLAVAVALGALARAAEPDPAPPPAPAPVPAPAPGAQSLTAPVPLSEPPTELDYPADGPPFASPLLVRVVLAIDASGRVTDVTLVDPTPASAADADAPARRFAEAFVTRASRAFRFTPATLDGAPVAVSLPFAQTFVPVAEPTPSGPTGPTAPTQETGPAAGRALLRGRLVTRGTRDPVPGAIVVAVVDGDPEGPIEHATDADDAGRFALELPPGRATIRVQAAGYRPFLRREALAADATRAVGYLLDAERNDPYTFVVRGKKKREAPVAISGAELHQTAGTFGDPFRVVQALPGVAAVMSLLPMPIVRGASPGSTGFMIDGVMVPLLYHLLAGPSVIHPDFIDDVEFFPGGFPVTYGGYTAGIVDGHTHRARADERLLDVELDLTKVGGLVRQPLGDVTITAAGRWGYPGWLVELGSNGQTSLSYWDYQLRFDFGDADRQTTLFVYGASDVLSAYEETDPDSVEAPVGGDSGPVDPTPKGRLTPILTQRFHRLDLRHQFHLGHGPGAVDGTYRLVFGYDESITGATAAVRSLRLEPRFAWRIAAAKELVVGVGLDGAYRDTTDLGDVVSDSNSADIDPSVLAPGPTAAAGALWTELEWRPKPDFVARPGLRADLRWDGETTVPTLDPRLALRFRLGPLLADETAPPTDDDMAWLELKVGLYHQPGRLFVPMPGADELPLRHGELASIQSSVALELPIERRFRVDVSAYYTAMDPVIFDLELNPNVIDFTDTGSTQNDDADDILERFLVRQSGRAYGLELMLRARDMGEGLHGWISYTLSASDRKRDGEWVPFDFDRRHLLNVVAALSLPRNWDFSVRLQYQSGRPVTTSLGYNTGRGEGYLRLDLRFDKRAVWQSWLLDFYVDLMNAALMPEEVTQGSPITYLLPTFGVRGRF